jgi:hypothetical protein
MYLTGWAGLVCKYRHNPRALQAHPQNTTILSQPHRDRLLLHEYKQGGMRISCLEKKLKNKKPADK